MTRKQNQKLLIAAVKQDTNQSRVSHFPQCTIVRVLFCISLSLSKSQNQTRYLPIRLLSQSETPVKPKPKPKTYLSFSGSTKVLKYWQGYLMREHKKIH